MRVESLIGHGIAVVLGLAALVGGVEAFAHDLPNVMGMSLFVIGIIAPLLAWRSWQHSRAAWSFLMALLGVLAAVDFFGAPKVASVLGIGIAPTLVLPVLEVIAVIALATLRDEYRQVA